MCVQPSSKFCFLFTRAFYGLFTRYICELNPNDLGNIPLTCKAANVRCVEGFVHKLIAKGTSVEPWRCVFRFQSCVSDPVVF